MVAWPYSFLVCSSFTLYALVSFFCVLGVVVALQCPIGWCDLSEHSNELWSNGQVAFVLSLALTNIELLKVLPWKAESAHFDGSPTRKLLGVVIAISLLEDIPQLVQAKLSPSDLATSLRKSVTRISFYQTHEKKLTDTQRVVYK